MYAKILLMTAILLSGQVYAQSTTTTETTTVVKKKKKKKIVPATETAAGVTATSAAPALEVKKEEPKKAEVVAPYVAPPTFLSYMKDHFSASYHGEYYAVRRDAESADKKDHDIQDIKIMHNPTLIYKPSPNWQALATAEFKYSDQPNTVVGPAYPNDFYRALFTVTRKNIFTEKENGLQVDAGVGRRVFNTGREQQPKNPPVLPAGGKYPLPSYGNDRAFTTMTKTFGKSNASLFLQYLHNNYKKAVATTWVHSVEVIPTLNLQLTEKLSYLFNDDIAFNTPKYKNTARDFTTSHEMNVAYLNYQWTDKINTYYQFKYYHTDDFTKAPQTQNDYFEHYAGVGYAFTPKATVTFEVGSEIFRARDGRDFFSKKVAYPELAMYLDFSI
ncbi:MAG: hypothetical protein H7281_13925 [Bacteriovorax sp.]|nr:hypothetical protein [Bacteriovorax sp.]